MITPLTICYIEQQLNGINLSFKYLTLKRPCLSCDILMPSDHCLPLHSGYKEMDEYPYTIYVVGGT